MDNVRGSLRTVKFATSSTYITQDTWLTLQFPAGLSGGVRSTGLLMLQLIEDTTNFTPIKSAVFIDWQEISGKIHIMFISGLKASTNYRLTVLVI